MRAVAGAVVARNKGFVLTMKQCHKLAARTEFIIEPHIRFKGEPGEQATMFFLDPSGNAIEFKRFEPSITTH